MTNKIDAVLKAITDQIAGALPSDTVKNPKLSASPFLSAYSYPTIDPQCSSHPATSINAIKARSKKANISQASLLQTRMGIKLQQPKELEPTLEDKFQDFHLNLPVLKVLSHAPIYNAILDKYPVGIVKDVEIHIGKLKLLNDFYVIDMKKDPKTPLLVEREFLATANAVIDCRMAKIAVGEGITRSVFGVKGVDLGEEEAPYWTTLGKKESYKTRTHSDGDTLVFRRMVEFLGDIPINLKSNMWESEDLIKRPINLDKPPKNGDGAWHAKIRLIDPDGEEFTKTLQSIPTTKKLFKRKSPREIIDLDYFYDT
ncbi:MAK10-like protein [Tanacetum coccineum]|uniref:MAK10-like protein n=1 Tax=Tanacetum coccineum TaxID=301880 RepID=A0ABQ5FJC4_9ASTR